MTGLAPLRVTADRWARTPWSAKARRRQEVMAYVRAAERAHAADYGFGYRGAGRGNSNVRTGQMNMPKEQAA